MLDTRKKFYRRERGGRGEFLDRITGLGGICFSRLGVPSKAGSATSASFVLKASFRHRDLPSSTGAFYNGPFIKPAKKAVAGMVNGE